MTVCDAQDLAARYAALWNEPDPELRRKAIQELWSEDGAHILQPPADIRERAASLGFVSTVLEAHGYDALEVRVSRSHAEFVASGQYAFQARGDAVRMHDVVKFTWEMMPVGGGDAVGGGVEVLVLGADGRIKFDYMFPGI
jgi:hypothetical protein